MQSEIAAYLAKNPEPQSIDVLIADANGILRGKQFPGSGLEKLFKKGANFPLSLLFCDARGATAPGLLQPPLMGDPDVTYMPVPGTLRPVPWATVPTVQIMLRALDDQGAPHPLDPLSVLQTSIDAFKSAGLRPVAALEGEFYLLDPTKTPPEPLKSSNGWPDFEGPQVYALEPLRDVQGFVDQIKDVAAQQSLPLTSIVCEYGASQFEMNLDHSDDLGDPLLRLSDA